MNWKKDFEEKFCSETGETCAWHSNFELQLFITKIIQEIIDDLKNDPNKQSELKKKYL